jgi:hypothetical protein
VLPLREKERERERKRLQNGAALSPSKEFSEYKERLENNEKTRYFSEKKRSYHTPSKLLETTEPIQVFKSPSTNIESEDSGDDENANEGDLQPRSNIPRPSDSLLLHPPPTTSSRVFTPKMKGLKPTQKLPQGKTPVIVPSNVC